MRQMMRKLGAASCVVAVCLAALPVVAQNPGDFFDANEAERNPGQVVRLEDQLTNGLRVVTIEQRLYINQIVTMVESGQMPRAMVNVVYSWALKRNPSVPLPYFQVALRALGERRGIAVP